MNPCNLTYDECDALFDKAETTTKEQIVAAYTRLFEQYTLLSMGLSRGETFWRGRPCESSDGFANLLEVRYPPHSKTIVGRLNDAGQPLLYCSSGLLTVFNELDLPDGSFIHCIAAKSWPETEIRIAVIGEAITIFRQRYSLLFGDKGSEAIYKIIASQFDDPRIMRALYLDAYFSRILADPIAKSSEYLKTRIIGRLGFSKIEGVEGLWYPSVRERFGRNVAFLPSVWNKLQVVASAVFQINRKRGFGFYEFDIVRNANSLNEDLSFDWSDKVRSARVKFFNLTSKESKKMHETHVDLGLPPDPSYRGDA